MDLIKIWKQFTFRYLRANIDWIFSYQNSINPESTYSMVICSLYSSMLYDLSPSNTDFYTEKKTWDYTTQARLVLYHATVKV